MERVHTDSEMEGILSRSLGEVLVGTDTSSFKSFGSDLLDFVTD